VLSKRAIKREAKRVGGRVGMAPIHAAERGDLEEVMRLVQEDPGVVDSSDDDMMGRTALHYASSGSCRGGLLPVGSGG